MGIKLRLKITDEVTPVLAQFNRELRDRTNLNQSIAEAEQTMFRKHVSAISSRRHQTANRLGATPTGHLEKASGSIEAHGDSGGVQISFPRSTGLHRAFGDLVITPKRRKYITIPVHKLAYGKRAREFGDLIALRVGTRGTLILARRIRGQEILETMYVLVKKVRQRQDRTLLPDDQAILETAEKAAKDYLVDDVLKGKGGRA